MADQESASAVKAKRTVAILKLTGRNEEGNEPSTIGDAIHAVFADCSEAGSNGDLEETDPVVLQALDGWLSLDDALDELPTGTRDELCISALSQALDDIDKLHAQVRARLNNRQIRGFRQTTCPPLPPEDGRFDPTSHIPKCSSRRDLGVAVCRTNGIFWPRPPL